MKSKEKFLVVIVKNETGEHTEVYPYYSKAEAEQIFEGKKSQDIYGPDKVFRVELIDKSAEQSKHLEVQDRASDREFGLHMIDVIAAFNKKYFDKAQVQSLFAHPGYMAVILGFLTGGLESTRDAVAAIGPQLYPQDFVAQVLAAMDAQIAKSNPPPETEPEPETEEPGETPDQNPEEPTEPPGESSSEPV